MLRIGDRLTSVWWTVGLTTARYATPQGDLVRPCARVVELTFFSPQNILFEYTGIVTLNAEIGAVFAGADNMATTGFGNAATVMEFKVRSLLFRHLVGGCSRR